MDNSLIASIKKWQIKTTEDSIHHYTIFGIFGIVFCILPYFVWPHNTDLKAITLTYRIIACILCFTLIIYHQSLLYQIQSDLKTLHTQDSNTLLSRDQQEKFAADIINNSLLPFYWHITLCYCLPAMSIYNILDSNFDTAWIVNALLGILAIVLLLDWTNYMAINLIGWTLGYLMFALTSDTPEIMHSNVNYVLVIYAYIISILIARVFLHQKQTIIKQLRDSNNERDAINKNLDALVSQRTKELNKILKYRTDFINNISHEIRTPLQGIIGISSALHQSWKDLTDSEREMQLTVVLESGQRLLTLLSNLLDFSKLEAGKMIMKIERNNVILALDSAIMQLKPFYLTMKTNINFSRPANIEPYNTNFDLEGIRSVLRNIISNAIKFTSNHIVEISIDFTDESHNHINYLEAKHIQISIKDYGPGIPDEELENIFLPFAQTSVGTKIKGTGIGLSMAGEIIKQHHGQILVQKNHASNGTTFSVILPYQYTESDVTKDKAAKNKNNIQYNKIKILFVDDEKYCNITGKVMLESVGFEVHIADCGTKALDMLNKDKYDLIMLDLMMPDMSGTDVLAAKKFNKLNLSTPVIVQSGASDKNDIAKAMSEGAFAYILKPYSKDEMLEKINHLIAEARSSQTNS